MCPSLDHLLKTLEDLCRALLQLGEHRALVPHHISNVRITVVGHSVLERFQKILLELEVRQLFLLQESHGQLTEGVQGEEADMWIIVTTDLQSANIQSASANQ
jgi:hypothetical protein